MTFAFVALLALGGTELPKLELKDASGATFDLATLHGRVVLLDVWASWCVPCRQALPFYEELQRRYGERGLTVIGVSVDQEDAAVAKFLVSQPVTFKVLRDSSGKVPTALDLRSMPTSFLFDHRGVRRLKHEGFTPGDRQKLTAEVEKLLAELPKGASIERPLMGTKFSVEIAGVDSPEARSAIEACFALFDDVDRVMSEWKPDSVVSEINRAAGVHPVAVPPELMTVLARAQEVAEQSGGAFDVTWGALFGTWRFGVDARVPSQEEIAAKLALVGYRDLVLDPQAQTAFLRRVGMAIGLGGIAKGHALGRCATELRRRGFADFLLYAGGQVYAAGTKAGRPWRVAIQHPRHSGGVLGVVELHDASISTSGDYERFFERDGVRYHHIIDLKTGFPARASQCATVIARDPTLADAYSTAAFVLGADRALELARSQGFELTLVDAEGRVHTTANLEREIAATSKP